jgi:hypothetical protein
MNRKTSGSKLNRGAHTAMDSTQARRPEQPGRRLPVQSTFSRVGLNPPEHALDLISDPFVTGHFHPELTDGQFQPPKLIPAAATFAVPK